MRFGVQLDGATVVLYRSGILAFVRVYVAPVAIGCGILGVQLDGAIVVLYRSVILAFVRVYVAPVVIG